MKTAFRFRGSVAFLITFRLWSSKNQIVGVGSTSRTTKPITNRGKVYCDCFVLLLLLQTPAIWFLLDHKRNLSEGNVLILLTPIPSRLWLRLRLRFFISVGQKRFYDPAYDSGSDSVACVQTSPISFVAREKRDVCVTLLLIVFQRPAGRVFYFA